MTAALENSRRHHNLIFLLVPFYLLSAVLAVPATRSIKLIEAYSSIPDLTEIQIYRRGRYALEGRMGIEVADYEGPGANPGHEPPSPTPTRKG